MTAGSEVEERRRFRSGLLYGLGAYGFWGLMPIYFWAVREVPAEEILAHRKFWCGVLLAVILTLARRWPDVVHCLKSGKMCAVLFVCSLFLAINWFIYIYAALSQRVSQASLGYFLLPLLNVIFGLVLFRERLRPAQWLGVVLAAFGVAYIIVAAGAVPWLALTIAVSFTLYGVLRKLTPIDALVGLFVETLFLAPVSAGFLLWWYFQGTGAFRTVDAQTDGLLLLSGIVTAVPLLCFGQAARRLPLTTMGFMQYFAPSLQLLLAVWYFDEPFGEEQRICFGCIWTALAIVTFDSLWRARRNGPALIPCDEI